MHDTHEPSYYEIALTNRQVMVVFVVLLMSVIAAFLSGVWVGRGEPADRTVIAERIRPAAAGDAAGEGADEEVRSLNFFTDDDGKRGAGDSSEPEAPLAAVVENPRQGTTLVEDVAGNAPPPIIEEAPKPQPVEKPEPKREPARVAAAPAVERTSTAATSTPNPDGFVVQVFSSGDEGQASRVRDKLRTSGYSAFLSPVTVDTRTMYRVRVGPFVARAEAETAATRVKQDFKYDTWITR